MNNFSVFFLGDFGKPPGPQENPCTSSSTPNPPSAQSRSRNQPPHRGKNGSNITQPWCVSKEEQPATGIFSNANAKKERNATAMQLPNDPLVSALAWQKGISYGGKPRDVRGTPLHGRSPHFKGLRDRFGGWPQGGDQWGRFYIEAARRLATRTSTRWRGGLPPQSPPTLDGVGPSSQWRPAAAGDSAGAEVPVRRVVKADTGPPSHRSGPPSLDSSPTMALLNPSRGRFALGSVATV